MRKQKKTVKFGKIKTGSSQERLWAYEDRDYLDDKRYSDYSSERNSDYNPEKYSDYSPERYSDYSPER